MRICVPVPCFFPKMDFVDAIYKIKELGFDVDSEGNITW